MAKPGGLGEDGELSSFGPDTERSRRERHRKQNLGARRGRNRSFRVNRGFNWDENWIVRVRERHGIAE